MNRFYKQNLTKLAMIVLWVIGLLLISACQTQQKTHPMDETLPSPVSPNELTEITLDEPMRLSLTDNGPVTVVYNGDGPIRIRVEPLDADNPFDVVLKVLDADFNQLAYRDGTSEGSERIDNLALTGSAPYMIQVNSFNGIQTGEVEITLSQMETTIDEDESVEIDLAQSAMLKQELPVVADTTYVVTASSLDVDHDLRLSVYDADGMLVASNDDHSSEDESLSSLDARVAFTAEGDVIFTLEITEFLGRATRFTLKIEPTGS